MIIPIEVKLDTKNNLGKFLHLYSILCKKKKNIYIYKEEIFKSSAKII